MLIRSKRNLILSQQSRAHREEDKPQSKDVDAGLTCLITIARFHQVAADPAQIQHHFGSHDEPLDETALIRAARHLKLKGESLRKAMSKITESDHSE